MVEYTWESPDHQVTVMFHSRVYPNNPCTVMFHSRVYRGSYSVLIILHSNESDKIYVKVRQRKGVIADF